MIPDLLSDLRTGVQHVVNSYFSSVVLQGGVKEQDTWKHKLITFIKKGERKFVKQVLSFQ